MRSTANGPIVSGLTDDFTAIAENPYTGTGGAVASPPMPRRATTR